MTETMKVTEAIGQLKTQEERISKAYQSFLPIVANRISASKVEGLEPDEFNKNAKSSYDSVRSLIARYVAIKEAINEFNAATKINVSGVEMSVASALYLKSFGINQKKFLVGFLTEQLNKAERKMQTENGEKLDAAAERYAKMLAEGDTKQDKIKYLEFIEQYKDRNQFVLVDPINIRKEIEKITDEISRFEAGVDTAIQIANATHDITINY